MILADNARMQTETSEALEIAKALPAVQFSLEEMHGSSESPALVTPFPSVLCSQFTPKFLTVVTVPSAVGGYVASVDKQAVLAPWLAVVGLVGCIGTAVVVAKKRRP